MWQRAGYMRCSFTLRRLAVTSESLRNPDETAYPVESYNHRAPSARVVCIAYESGRGQSTGG